MKASILAPPVTITVPRDWPGATVVCLGGGPSLTQADVDFVRGKAKVIAINDAYKLAPWADVHYAADAKWWYWHQGAPTFTGPKYAITAQSARYFPEIRVLQHTGTDGLELKPTGLRGGHNSGYQAINLAVHYGASRIVLLGYDMQDSKRHWFGEHPDGSGPPLNMCLRRFPTLVEPLRKLGVEVINCTRRTALTCFPQQPLEAVFP